MIFTSLGMFIASLCFLIAGIVRSSVPLLVVSLVATVVAAFVLLATADLARRRAWEASGLPTAMANASGGGPPGTQPVIMYVPTTEAAPVAAAGGNGAPAASPFLGYDDMSAAQVTKLVSSGALTTEQLVAVRRYETDNAARKSVLERVDRAIRS